jgi:hypothetical protein
MAIRVSKDLKGPVASKICTSGKARNPTRRVLGAIGGVFGLYAGRAMATRQVSVTSAMAAAFYGASGIRQPAVVL